MAESQHAYFAVRRGEKWITKRVEDATAQDLRGLDLSREFMSAVTTRDELEAGMVQIDTNLRTGADPFEALREIEADSTGLDVLRKAIREAGYRVTVVSGHA